MRRRAVRALGVGFAAILLSACQPSVTLSEPDETSPPTDAGRNSGAPAPPRTAQPPTLSPRSEPSSPSSPSSPEPELDGWEVGASPLPLRPDGFGRVLRTPEELRVRRMPTQDRLPPPEDGFSSSIEPVTRAVRERMGETWSPECPVGLADLRYLTVSFWGFDDRAHTGELVVNARVAEDVVGVFRRLFAAHFPIEEMRLVTTADLDAPPTGDGNNTAALVCRPTRGQDSWSAHAYGLAVDVNPFQNPYQKDDLVLPELASAYLDRDWRRPGMIGSDGVVVEAFEDVGWTWGGDFDSLTDLMHFSATGR